MFRKKKNPFSVKNKIYKIQYSKNREGKQVARSFLVANFCSEVSVLIPGVCCLLKSRFAFGPLDLRIAFQCVLIPGVFAY